MAFCSKCGNQLEDNAAFCNYCGTPVGGDMNQTSQSTQTSSDANDYMEKIKGLNNTEDTTHTFDQNDIAQNKAMGILAYIGLLVLVPILCAKESKFARYHANQGLVLWLASIAFSIVTGIVDTAISAISWRLGLLASLVFGLGNLALFIIMIIGIVNAASGKAKELPIIGKIKILSL
ncbi:MAG: zinc-ribbon domain-containing protein [Lachnospiraceae bacterium]|nr:zinc-ribbon domain-containing protein [Lachnospiraceae bacterium]